MTRAADRSPSSLLDALQDREVLLGVSGGIAAYKAAELTSLLTKSGARPTVIMTEAATKLVAPKTFEALSRRPVALTMWGDARIHPHIELARQARVLCVAPTTADLGAKLACGFADDLLTTTVLAFEGALILAPAMNAAMWRKPATQRNFARLVEDGATLVGPSTGALSCGESGIGRMSEPREILEAIARAFVELDAQDASRER